MSWMNSVANGAQGFMDSIDTTASSTGGLFETAAKYATDAFDWLNDNPAAANVLGGLATGAASYYAAEQAQESRFDFERDLYREKRRDQMINPGTIDNYGSHVGSAKKGLLSNGMIAGGR